MRNLRELLFASTAALALGVHPTDAKSPQGIPGEECYMTAKLAHGQTLDYTRDTTRIGARADYEPVGNKPRGTVIYNADMRQATILEYPLGQKGRSRDVPFEQVDSARPVESLIENAVGNRIINPKQTAPCEKQTFPSILFLREIPR